jgi:hypothetical protein
MFTSGHKSGRQNGRIAYFGGIMICTTAKPCKVFAALVFFALLLVNIAPGVIRHHKPANPDAAYSAGWNDACATALNTLSPLRSWFVDVPYTKTNLDDKSNYKQGWNEGFTLCRFTQDTLDRWVQTFLIIAAILFAFRANKAS